MSSNQQCAWAAENNGSASCSMSADIYTANFLTAIMTLMAAVLLISVCDPLAVCVLIGIILGIIILVVRGEIKPFSRTR
ncbi:MAG: hypothetical protein IJI14_11310 [Anaerolineaceae bacterium]|nr:hypothetical protein [Anaerolineaceae bacterium]